jgi:hypothetical protein
LHLTGVQVANALVGIFFLIVFIDPLRPIDLDVLVLLGGLDESGPKGAIAILFLEDEEHMEAGFVPLGQFSSHFLEEFKLECVLFAATFSFKVEMGGCQVHLFVDDVHEMDLNEEAVFALGPFGGRVAELERGVQHIVLKDRLLLYSRKY